MAMPTRPTSAAVADHPIWGKAVSAAMGGAGAAAVFYVILSFGRTRGAMLILVGGLLGVALLLVLYKLLLGWLRRRKAAPMTRSILANSSAAPHGISDPAKRAKLDEMRKSFETGVAKFKAAGKDLYTLPWYVLVGEPGGGKTEAIRHSQVGFPHGLQDYMQGAGGTVNMNWWFTNHAIILDTAGRLMFEEVAPGATNEWNEFLQLLHQHRPNCPINGMVLVIPADTLIKDSTEAIERKAGKIAQQLDLIQRTLEVRFPVFVAISKCDLISGFREFFETLDDPQLQGQILGWSNPASLDQPFNPDAVDQHLETVRQRLAARRYGLLLDPVHTEDPEARRIDQVDALYTFPDSLGRVGPRLRRYLETIFVAGEWSPKPLFLRGIYFTSSMREGAALDAELADVLKVPVDSLQDEGRIWERNKTYFLREPFLKKVFVEKGLVTRAARPNRLHRTRKIAILAASFVAILALFGLTAKGVRDFRAKLGNESEFWPAVQQNYAGWAIVDDAGAYRGEDKAKGVGVPLGAFFEDAPERVERKIDVPSAFKGPSFVLDDFSGPKRKSAYRTVYESSVVRPLLVQARRKLAAAGEWSPEATDALTELVRLEAEASAASAAGAQLWQPRVRLDPLFKFVLNPREYNDSFLPQQEKLGAKKRDVVSVADWLYSGEADRQREPTWMGFTTPGSTQAINAALFNFERHWQAQVNQQDEWFRGVSQLQDALSKYQTASDAAEREVASVQGPAVTTVKYAAFRDLLDAQLARLAQPRARVEMAVKNLRRDGARASIANAYNEKIRQLEQRAEKAYADLRDAASASPVVLESMGKAPRRQTPGTSPADELFALDAQLQPPAVQALANAPRYAAHEQVYRWALEALDGAKVATPQAEGSGQLRQALGTVDSEADAQLKSIEQLDQQAQNERLSLKQGCVTWKLAVQSAAALKRHVVLAAVVDRFRGGTTEDQVKRLVREPLAHPVTVPFTAIDRARSFRPEFEPTAAQTLLKSARDLRAHLPADADAPGAGPDPKQRVLEFDALRARYDAVRAGIGQYLEKYAEYWGQEVPRLAEFDPNQLRRWPEFFKDGDGAPRRWNADAINSDLEQIVLLVVSALEVAGGMSDAMAQSAAREMAADINSVRVRMKTSTFQGACHRVLQNWLQSRGNASSARRVILDLKPGEFMSGYVFPDLEGGFVTQYWSALSYRVLELLAAQCAEDGAAEYRKSVAPHDGFPLVLNTRNLKLTEVDAAREAIEKFLGGHWPGEGGGGAGDTVRSGATIRQRNLPADFAGNQLLSQLIVPAGDAARFASLKKVFDALSPANPATCTIFLMDAETREKRRAPNVRLPDDRWSDIRMQQDGKAERPLRVSPVQNGRNLLLGRFNCRSESPIVIEMAERAAAAARQKWQGWQFNAPSPALRTVYRAGLVKQAVLRGTKVENGETQQTWDVEVEVTDTNRAVYSLWLTVVFDRELPKTEEWSRPLRPLAR